MELPPAPDDLPERPARFWRALREAVAGDDVVWAHAEDDGVQFGDAGVGITLTHVNDPYWVVAAQVSRVHAVVFVGPAAVHPDAPEDAAGLVARALRGEVAVTLRYRGDALAAVAADDADGTPLVRSRVGGPATWARWRPAAEETRRIDFRRAP